MIDIYEVIQTASDQHVRTLLRLLCESDYQIKHEAQKLHDTVVSLQSNSKSSSSAGDSKKRGREAEVLYCIKCEDCFIEEENHDKACAYHPGEFEADEDFFADDDAYQNGEVDDEEMFKEYPEGFVMTCCNRKGDTEGCTIGRHAGTEPRKQRQTAPGAGDDEDEDKEEEYEDDDEDD
ncbi:hypothetical protein ABW20_dc0103561 [Dactylellina cionopaga]|nr:hypothetical protein ABW20_dc0103561 [Dactylellina cionopaga]